jgi:hypothetical protein
MQRYGAGPQPWSCRLQPWILASAATTCVYSHGLLFRLQPWILASTAMTCVYSHGLLLRLQPWILLRCVYAALPDEYGACPYNPSSYTMHSCAYNREFLHAACMHRAPRCIGTVARFIVLIVHRVSP